MAATLNRMTIPFSAFGRWIADNGVSEPNPHHTAGQYACRLLGPAAPKALRIDGEGDLVIHCWGDGVAEAARKAGIDAEAKAIADLPAAGTHLRFKLRACPVTRRGGAEHDAYIAGKNAGLSRRDAYRAWLERNLAGATIVDFDVEKSGIAPIGLAKSRTFFKPYAEMEGVIEVADKAAFAATLDGSVGRHGRLGFGALMIAAA